jgi:hypothetical protein
MNKEKGGVVGDSFKYDALSLFLSQGTEPSQRWSGDASCMAKESETHDTKHGPTPNERTNAAASHRAVPCCCCCAAAADLSLAYFDWWREVLAMVSSLEFSNIHLIFSLEAMNKLNFYSGEFAFV